jgi:hypothetical protein
MVDEVVVSTRDRAGTFDAIETAKPGEPIFTLQGGDPHAPPTILHWARLAREAAIGIDKREDAERLLRKASVAETVAWAMQDYQRGEVDAPPAGAEEPEETPTGEAADFARLCDRLYNAVAEVGAVAEALEATHTHLVAAAMVRRAMSDLGDAAADFEPRRHLQREGGRDG